MCADVSFNLGALLELEKLEGERVLRIVRGLVGALARKLGVDGRLRMNGRLLPLFDGLHMVIVSTMRSWNGLPADAI